MKLYVKLFLGLSFGPGLLLSVMNPVFASSFYSQVQGYSQQDNKLILETEQGKVSIEYITNSSIYVHYLPSGTQQLPGYLLDEKLKSASSSRQLPGSNSSSSKNPNSNGQSNQRQYQLRAGNWIENNAVDNNTLTFSSDVSAVLIQKSPLRLSFFHQGKQLLAEESGYFESDESRGFRFKLTEKEKLFAGGQRVVGMDRRGLTLPLYNKAHYGYEDSAKQMYYGLPGLMSSEKYILMFDNSAKGSLDLGASEKDILQFEAQAGRSAYLVSMSDNYPSLLDHYTRASGKQPMPPIWALGNMASRFGYRSEQQARDVVAEYQKQKMPLDAIIFDLYWFGPEIKGFMGDLDWDRKTFPNGEKMVRDFDKQGVNTILISEPFILTSSKNWQSGADAGAFAQDNTGKAKTFDFYFGHTSLVDVFSEQGQQWFWSFYQKQLDWGVAGFWGDLGEPEVHPQDTQHQISRSGQVAGADEIHNVYGHQWAKTLFEGFSKAKPEQRPFIMMRSGFAGSQRYGLIPWTGDVSRTWAGLKSQVELSLQMGLLGLGYTHSDLGGFIDTDTFDAELYVRWLQFGAFQPVFRPHAADSVLPEPVFHGEEVAALVKAALSWRYQLLPYNYTLAYQNHRLGTPFMRPTFFNETHGQKDAQRLDTDGYFWGPNLLILPITAPGISELVYELPQGNWYDYFSDTMYRTGKQNIPVTKEQIPVLVKGGAIIPQAPNMLNTREYSGETLIIHYWFDIDVANSAFQLYQDDGLSRDYQNGEFTLIDFSAHVSELKLGKQKHGKKQIGTPEVNFTISLAEAGQKLTQKKQLKLVVHNAASLKHVYQDEKQLSSHYDSAAKLLTLDVVFDGKSQTLVFK